MIFFWFLLPIFLVLFYNKGRVKLSYFLSLILFIILGFRDITTGNNDGENYYSLFLLGEDYMTEHNVELFYVLINSFLIKYGLSFQWVLIVMSFISIACIFYAAHRSTRTEFKVIVFFVLLTYYFYNFNAMRQMTSISILILSYTYLYDKRIRAFLILVIVASLFHKSSLIALLLLFFYKDKVQFSHPVASLLLISSFIIGGFNLAAPLLGQLEVLFPEKYLARANEETIVGSSFSISKLLLTVFFIYIYGKIDKRDLYLKIALLGIVLFNFMSFSVVALRIAYPLTTAQILLYSSTPFVKVKNDKQLNLIILAYAVFLYYYMLVHNISGVLDYKFCGWGFIFGK